MIAIVETLTIVFFKISVLHQTLFTKQMSPIMQIIKKRVYLEVSETPFKERYTNHVRDSKQERCSDATELSKNVWELKQNKKVPTIKMKIARKVYGNPKRSFCRSCLKGKLLIIKFSNQDILLNKRSVFISKCRHENKLLIVNMKQRTLDNYFFDNVQIFVLSVFFKRQQLSYLL